MSSFLDYLTITGLKIRSTMHLLSLKSNEKTSHECCLLCDQISGVLVCNIQAVFMFYVSVSLLCISQFSCVVVCATVILKGKA